MSMNLFLEATITLLNPKTNKKVKITEDIDLWQTPTFVTKAAIRSSDPFKVYKDWVLSLGHEDNHYHLNEIEERINKYKNDGYLLEFYEM